MIILGFSVYFLLLRFSLWSRMASQYLGMCSLACTMSLGCLSLNLSLLLSQSFFSMYLGVVSQ